MKGYISRASAIKRLGCTKEEFSQLLKDGLISYERKESGGYLISEGSLKAYQQRQAEDQLLILQKRVGMLEYELTMMRNALKGHGIDLPTSTIQESSRFPRLGQFGFSRRIMTIFRANGISTVEQLASYKESELKQIKGIGRKTVDELAWFLETKGMSLSK